MAAYNLERRTLKHQTISTEQFTSAAFLCDMLREYQNLNWDQSSQQLSACRPEESYDHKLVISCQSLTLQQLSGVLEMVAEQINTGSFALHPHSSYLDVTVIVVTVLGCQSAPDEIHPILESAAKRFRCEVALIGTTPTLSEPGLLVMDMDSTVIQIECIDEIAKLAGLGEQVSAVTERAMRGELDFKESLRSRVGCLDGVEVSQLAQIRDSIPLMPGLQNLLNVLKQHGWKIAIASGGFTYFAGYLEQRLGLDASRANVLEQENGVLTGRVVGDIVDAEVKAQTVQALAEEWGIPMSQTVAMGDGANDLKMMGVAALGVAFEAKPIVNAQADAAIRYSGLDTLLTYLS